MTTAQTQAKPKTENPRIRLVLAGTMLTVQVCKWATATAHVDGYQAALPTPPTPQTPCLSSPSAWTVSSALSTAFHDGFSLPIFNSFVQTSLALHTELIMCCQRQFNRNLYCYLIYVTALPEVGYSLQKGYMWRRYGSEGFRKSLIFNIQF